MRSFAGEKSTSEFAELLARIFSVIHNLQSARLAAGSQSDAYILCMNSIRFVQADLKRDSKR